MSDEFSLYFFWKSKTHEKLKKDSERKVCYFVSRYIGVFVWVRCHLWTLKLGITFRVGSHFSWHPNHNPCCNRFIVEVFSFPPFCPFFPLHRACMYLNLHRDFLFSYKGVWNNVKYFSFALFLVLFVASDPCFCAFWIVLSRNLTVF